MITFKLCTYSKWTTRSFMRKTAITSSIIHNQTPPLHSIIHLHITSKTYISHLLIIELWTNLERMISAMAFNSSASIKLYTAELSQQQVMYSPKYILKVSLDFRAIYTLNNCSLVRFLWGGGVCHSCTLTAILHPFHRQYHMNCMLASQCMERERDQLCFPPDQTTCLPAWLW